MTAPKRIQMRRTKGWRKPEGAIYVGRPSKWGNPYRVERAPGGLWGVAEADGAPLFHRREDAADEAVSAYRVGIVPMFSAEEFAALRGRDLACWCPLDQPCHADVLLEWANR